MKKYIGLCALLGSMALTSGCASMDFISDSMSRSGISYNGDTGNFIQRDTSFMTKDQEREYDQKYYFDE